MEAYKQWVRANRQFVSSIENLAQAMTWFLPERFSASEIGAEAVSSLVGLISLINQHITEGFSSHSGIPGHVTQYLENSKVNEDSEFSWSLCIAAVKEIEVLIEVAAEHFLGKDEKWSFVAATEAIKALLRLTLLHKSGYKMLIDGGVTPNISAVGMIPESGMPLSGYQDQRTSQANWEMYPAVSSHSLEARTLRALRKFGEEAQAKRTSYFTRDQRNQEIRQQRHDSADSLEQMSIKHEKEYFPYSLVVGEVLFILRPLIYVLLIKKHGLQSWKPWLVSLVFELTGMGVLSKLNSSLHTSDGCYPFSKLEKQELKRRRLLWAFYIMRDPFFSKYTRTRLERSERMLSPIPIIGTLTGKAVELLIGVQARYSYISAS
eukprot:TRINITY_DN4128_c0_g1_i1.p1 TRINITY_DN4128_c0_g1~~TRINITY_DN4128_c0_g1_i1.p1  ORF type:complete len:377 (-),score=38.97 TRINITY_DN4128_c0_g1_i1:141-1271(-)